MSWPLLTTRAAESAISLGERDVVAALARATARIRGRRGRRRRRESAPRAARRECAPGASRVSTPRPSSGSACSGSARRSVAETQTLQPMHSRMSSGLPPRSCSAGRGRRLRDAAAPIRSSMPRADLRDHRVGRGEAPDPDHRLHGDALDEGDVFLLEALAGKARGHRIVRPVADVDVPEVGQLGEHLDDLLPSWSHDMPTSPRSSSTAKRMATAQDPPATSCVSRSSSRRSRARFSSEPPYSSDREL